MWVVTAPAAGMVVLGWLGPQCAPATERTAAVAPAPVTRSAPPADAGAPPPLQNIFPANPWNERRFDKFRKVEAVDPEWAPQVERQLRAALETDPPRAHVMHVECRSDTCVVGLAAWQSPGVDWPPWPDIRWSGNSGGKIEPRPDGWSELVLVLHRHARDQPSASPRVTAFASPAEDPDCQTALVDARAHARPRDPACRYVTGFAHNTLCFALSQQACACACGRAGLGPGCRLAGHVLWCSIPPERRRSVFYEY